MAAILELHAPHLDREALRMRGVEPDYPRSSRAEHLVGRSLSRCRRRFEICGSNQSSASEIRPSTSDSVTVVVCAYTERRWAVSPASGRFSCAPRRRLPEQCIVVIDHNDQLLGRARFSLPSDVEVLASEERQGLSGARNTGVRQRGVTSWPSSTMTRKPIPAGSRSCSRNTISPASWAPEVGQWPSGR